jgi:hypothetical protein
MWHDGWEGNTPIGPEIGRANGNLWLMPTFDLYRPIIPFWTITSYL